MHSQSPTPPPSKGAPAPSAPDAAAAGRAGDAGKQAALHAQISRICREILSPLVKTDGGEMYLVKVEGEDVYIHLAGTCAGCPGASITGDKVILPALRTAAAKVRVFLTTGVKVPEGAEKVGP